MDDTVTPVNETPIELTPAAPAEKKPRKPRRASAFRLMAESDVNSFSPVKDLDDARDKVANLADGVYYRVCVRERIVKSTPKPVEPKATVVVTRVR